jgi:dihydroorotate dehydrogenase electron transfer subunit
MFLQKDFEDVCDEVFVATDDGSAGFHGTVTDFLRGTDAREARVYACGPKAMLKSVAAWSLQTGMACQVSLEERMACGVGACLGCAVSVRAHGPDGFIYRKVCADGPVFGSEEVDWGDSEGLA